MSHAFSEIVGFQAQKNYFTGLIQRQHIPHAQLFIDASDGMALPLALSFVATLHCTQRSSAEACGTCDACQKLAHFSHPDLHFLYPTGTKEKKSTQTPNLATTWLQFIRHTPYATLEGWGETLGKGSKNLQIRREQVQHLKNSLYQKSFLGGAKTFIVWLPEHANLVAANAMLKMVEEPPPNAYFIFISHKPKKILPTLFSRLWHLHIPKLPDAELLATLTKATPELDDSQREKGVAMAKGNISLAYKVATGQLENHFESFADWLRALYRHHWKAILDNAEAFHAHNPQQQKNWIHYALQMFQDALYFYLHLDQAHYFKAEEKEFLHRLSKTLTLRQLLSIIYALLALQEAVQGNAYGRLAFIHCSLRIATTFRQP